MAKGGGGNSKTTTETKLSPQQSQLINMVAPILQDYAGKGVSGLSGMVYPNSTVAPANTNQTLGQTMLTQQAQGQLQGSVNQAIPGLNFLTSGAALDPNSNPALQGTINAAVRPLQENFQNVTLPGIRDSAIQAGGYGSNRQEINERLAANDLNRTIGDTSSAIAFQGYNAGLDAMGKSFAFAPSVWQGATTPAQAVSAVGTQQQQQSQAELTDQVNQWYNQKFLPLAIAQQIAGTAFGIPGGSTTSAVSGGGTSPYVGALGGAASGAALGSMIMPGWGTAGGAVLGGLLGLFGS